MPRKACCCVNNQISWPTSCCKPPENNCVGSTINISVDFYVKFFCEPNGNILIWKCANQEQYPIEFETEHWRMNLSYTLSEDDVAPPLPKANTAISLDPRFDTSLHEYNNEFNGPSTSYSGGDGYLGGVFPPRSYDVPSGPIVTGRCIKCTNPCDAATKIQGCHPIYGPVGAGGVEILGPGCAVGYPGDIFGGASNQVIVNCADCCEEDIFKTINYQEKYHACDQCNSGENYDDGSYSIGIAKIDNTPEIFDVPTNLLSTDISLRENASWTFDFIPSNENQVSKLNIQLLSCHFGCSQRYSPGVYIANAFNYYKDYTTHLVDMYNIKAIGNLYNNNSITRFSDYMCIGPDRPCNLGDVNPVLRDTVCFAQTQYFNPPWCIGLECPVVSSCACQVCGSFGGSQCCEPPFEPANVIQRPCFNSGPFGGAYSFQYNKSFATNCGCCCDIPGTCYKTYYRSADPDIILRPHELSFELGIGYNSTTPCGESIQMDFYEELYNGLPSNPTNNLSKIDKHLVSSNGDRYVNPLWVKGIRAAANGAYDEFSSDSYNFYSQGMRMKLTYTRNSIPYEKYNHSGVQSCVPETIANPILDYPANNKIYPEYPKHGHPNLVNHPQGIYEGEYALSKASYWAPSLNSTYNTWYNPSPFAVQGSTTGIPQQTTPVDTKAFNKCYPFNTISNRVNIVSYPLTFTEFPFLDVDEPTKKQAYPLTYQYSYGDITAIVRQV